VTSATLHVGRPNIGDREALMNRINDMLDRRWFTNDGPLVKEFEDRIASAVGVKHCVTMCNATVALEIAYKALGFTGEVIVPSFTFVATAHALQWQGITPVFADIGESTHNLDPASVERLITPRTSGIVGVHLWGRPCRIDEIDAIARAHDLPVIYDAAHAFGCSYKNQMVGNFGACEVFSFHATKFLNSFEGGAVVTNDDSLAEKIRLMRNFGFRGFDNVEYLGVNGKMTEVCAAMGLTSLESVDALIDVNRANHESYRHGLTGLEGISLLSFDPAERNNWQYVVIEVDERLAGIARDELVKLLHDRNIIARKYFWPGCHRMEPYKSLQPDACRHLPSTEAIAARVIVLPTGQAVEESEVAAVCQIIRDAVS
jgi:dTDP-4-amino-4,6-dideoxygalactose transaminase